MRVRWREKKAQLQFTCDACRALERRVLAASQAARARENDLGARSLRAMLNVEMVKRVADDESHNQRLLALYLLRKLALSEQPSELVSEFVLFLIDSVGRRNMPIHDVLMNHALQIRVRACLWLISEVTWCRCWARMCTSTCAIVRR
jgi:hypothetical protein